MLRSLLAATLAAAPLAPRPTYALDPRAIDPRAAAVLDTAVARMGGEAALRRIERVRLEMMTVWQRTTFDERPYADAPSYELNTELRDYARRAWRNTRRFATGTAWRQTTDIVDDTVGARHFGSGPASLPGASAPAPGISPGTPLNVAYVDERRELFAFAPERVLLLAREARDLRALPDTSIAGVAHARVAATIDRFPATLFLRRSDGFLALARFRADERNDFGLVPWGEMEVELWYSRWQKQPASAIAYPMQWDVRRVGRPYKRMTVLAAHFDAAAPADSFAIGDSLRRAFFATANRPMHDVPFDSARVIDGRFASFGAFGAPAGAVKLGRQWVLLEAGQAPLSVERAAAWLARADEGSRLAGAIVTMPAAGNGGVAWLATHGVPMHVGRGAHPFVATMLRNRGARTTTVSEVTRARWLRVDGDSLRLEPIDLPDAPGSLVVWVPSLRWAYAATAMSPLHLELVMAHARSRGWTVERIGTTRAIATQAP